MNLSQKQRVFTKKFAVLTLRLYDLGYEITLGEVWRPPEMMAIYKAQGRGITNSLHWSRLAIDLNLWRNGKCLPITVSNFEAAGELWESLSEPEFHCCWGGRFGDADHFSVEHNGVK